MKRAFISIRHKMMTSVVLLLAFATLSFLYFARSLFNKDKTVYIYDSVASLAENLSAEMESNLTHTVRLLKIFSILAHRESIKNAILKEKDVMPLKELLDDERTVLGINVIERRGDNFREIYQYISKDSSLSREEMQTFLQADKVPKNFWQGKPLLEAFISLKGTPLLRIKVGTLKTDSYTLEAYGILDHSERYKLFKRSNLYAVFLATEQGKILLHTDLSLIGNGKLGEIRPKLQETLIQGVSKGAFEDTSSYGESHIVAFKRSNGLGVHTFAEIPISVAYQASSKLLEKTILVGVLILSIGIVVAVLSARRITSPLHKLTLATRRVAEGDLSINVPRNSRDEVGVLTENFNIMQAKVLSLLKITAEKARMEKELETAQFVQENLFPKSDIEIGTLSISAFYKPATECGGDLWGAFAKNRKIYVYIGDATGHGVSAALMTAVVHACSTTLVYFSNRQERVPLNPAEILGAMNTAVKRAGGSKIKMTMICFEIDIDSGEYIYSNASHLAAIVAKKTVHEGHSSMNLDCLVHEPDPCLGSSDMVKFHTQKGMLENGDALILFTDGLTEATDVKSRAYGDRRVSTSIKKSGLKSAALIKENILTDFFTQIKEDQRKDDVTLVVIKKSEKLSAKINMVS